MTQSPPFPRPHESGGLDIERGEGTRDAVRGSHFRGNEGECNGENGVDDDKGDVIPHNNPRHPEFNSGSMPEHPRHLTDFPLGSLPVLY